MKSNASEAAVRHFYTRRFKGLSDDGPVLARASGNSGFVAHLTFCTHGATGWDWSFRLVRPGPGWAFVNDGRVTLFVDEPGQYVPAEAKPGENVALRLPRARENLHPHRFSLFGGQGGCVTAQGFTKLFLPITLEAAPALIERFASHEADGLRFSLYVSNSPLDYVRADAALIDVGVQDEPQLLRLLGEFLSRHPTALRDAPAPYGTRPGPFRLSHAPAKDKADLADNWGWQVCTKAAQRDS